MIDGQPNQITKEEAIALIEEKYKAQYDPDSKLLDVFDQLEICESILETEPEYLDEVGHIDNVHVNGDVNGNGTYILNKFELFSPEKMKAIYQLSIYSYLTPPKVVAETLEFILTNPNTNPDHWRYIAQKYTPGTIRSVLRTMVKLQSRGEVNIQNPSAYLTYLLKFRTKRKNAKKNRHS